MTSVVEEEDNTTSKLQDEIDLLNAQITKQGSTVRTLKKENGSTEQIDEAIKLLQQLKIQCETLQKQNTINIPIFNRKSFDDLILRKMFVIPSFEIHGGVKGLYDLGPPACSLKVRFSYFFINNLES
jgi:glycyl-tRNA synthetase